MAGTIGSSGRPRKPTNIRLVEGNRGHRPLPKKEPKPQLGIPQKPKYIADDELASDEWDRIVINTTRKNARVLTVQDGHFLELAATAYSDFRQAREVLQREGTTYETVNAQGGAMVRKRPEVEVASDAWRRWKEALLHFGLSAATRGKVEKLDEEEDQDPARAYLDG